jgi:succinoglycan biosynthesis transport protein ExoP
MNEIARALRRHWRALCCFVALGMLGAGIGSLTVAPVYAASSSLYVATTAREGGLSSVALTLYAKTRMASFAQLASSDVVVRRAAADLGLREQPEVIAARISAEVRAGTLILDVTAQGDSPRAAQQLANAVTTNLRDQINSSIERDAVTGLRLIDVTVVSSAVKPTRASTLGLSISLAAGAFVGLVLWLGVALLGGLTTSKITGSMGVREQTAAPILAVIGHARRVFRLPVAVQGDPGDPFADALRRLRANLRFTIPAESGNAVVITSSLPGEGKTTTSVNLAIVTARAGERVLLIDADLRRPSVATSLCIDGSVGLTDVLLGRAELDDAVQRWGTENELAVLPAGSIPPHPGELLTSRALRALLAQLEGRYDTVILDSPPLLPANDAAVLAAQCSGAVVIVGSGAVSGAELERSLDRLALVHARVLGIVVNQVGQRGLEHGDRAVRRELDRVGA